MMNIIITGICGFVGSELATELRSRLADARIAGIDNLSRRGSERTRPALERAGIAVRHGDVRCASDVDTLGDADWVIDAAANPSVLAGVDGRSSGRQLVEHNLYGTVNLLEFCARRRAGFVLLSTSRVYSVAALQQLPLAVSSGAFVPRAESSWPSGAGPDGLREAFSTAGPVSLYGATKRASEIVAAEYGDAYGFPVVVNRCGVLAGAAQFGTAEQGIFSYWVRAWGAGQPLTYRGFGGAGYQVRDALHPGDLADLIERQIRGGASAAGVWNIGGGPGNAMSLAQLSDWCRHRFGPRDVGADSVMRRWDVPWIVMDATAAGARFGWRRTRSVADILAEIANHHDRHPEWLAVSGVS
ncbi:MAG TPA: NAD-dependent epimerase/dehydratase family protein [Vicinamibacterales bacterium]|nr:NAD-dependent epimerase/dehydratase family protein [Vicinamibacterales bacterium]